MKKIHSALLLFFLLCGSVATIYAQATIEPRDKNAVSAYRLAISTYNHAEQIFNGTTTYILTDTSITVKRRFLLSESEEVVF
ncbi:MAG: hypothetical protein JWP12_1754 [Bacteroidetes bacterium]|nr:hypothetical protein [Bacteroidota bacterium]